MNRPFTISAAVVLIAGAVVFARQSRSLAEIHNTSRPQPLAAAPATPSRPWSPPPAKRSDPDGRLLDRLGGKLVAALDPAQIAVFLEAADAIELGRMALTVSFSPEERKAFEDKLAAIRGEQAALMKRTGLT